MSTYTRRKKVRARSGESSTA